jgi:lipid-A-disaccharide synthase
MANLIAGREVVRELIQKDFRPQAVAAETLALMEDGPRRDSVLLGLAETRARLGGEGASRRAAEVVAAELDRTNKKD